MNFERKRKKKIFREKIGVNGGEEGEEGRRV